MKGTCSKCGHICDDKKKWLDGFKKPIADTLTNHHIYPVRHFGLKDNNKTEELCMRCHQIRLNKIIKAEERSITNLLGKNWVQKFKDDGSLKDFYNVIFVKFMIGYYDKEKIVL